MCTGSRYIIVCRGIYPGLSTGGEGDWVGVKKTVCDTGGDIGGGVNDKGLRGGGVYVGVVDEGGWERSSQTDSSICLTL